MPKSIYLINEVLNSVLRNTAFVVPTTSYVALYTVAPGIGGGGTEVTGGSYVRQAATFAAPSGGASATSADVVYPIATADWGTVVAFALFDASTAGNLLYFANLTVSRSILTNDQVKFPSGQLIVTES